MRGKRTLMKSAVPAGDLGRRRSARGDRSGVGGHAPQQPRQRQQPHGRALLLALLLAMVAAPVRTASPPPLPPPSPPQPPGVSPTTCTNTAWIFVAGFTGTSAWLNGFYVPYYDASLAPSGLRSCTNAGSTYGAGAGSSFSTSFSTSWQSAGHPAGYYNIGSSLSNSTNSFWVRDYDSGIVSQSYWNLVLGTSNCLVVDNNYYIYMSAQSNSVSGECACVCETL